MIKFKTSAEIESMKAAGAVSKAALRCVGAAIVPGVRAHDLERIAESVIRANGGVPAFKGYMGFPSSICCSVNDQIVHGIPTDDVVLKNGDIVSIDTGAIVNGWVGDNAWTFFCGTPSLQDKELCEVTRDCLKIAIKQAVPGNHLGDIGHAVQEHAERHGFGVIRDYAGHGIGREMHEEPSVRNFGHKGRGIKIQEGMVLAIEPMIVRGAYQTQVERNRWTVVSRDHSTAAHYENTVAVTADGPVILTSDGKGPWCPLEGGVA